MKMCSEYNDFFYADAESGEEQLGVSGRVFLHKFPEYTPFVENYSLKQYPQRKLTFCCSIGGSWALPVVERSSQTCVGEFGLQCFYGCKDCEMQVSDKPGCNAKYGILFSSIDIWANYTDLP